MLGDDGTANIVTDDKISEDPIGVEAEKLKAKVIMNVDEGTGLLVSGKGGELTGENGSPPEKDEVRTAKLSDTKSANDGGVEMSESSLI